MKSTVLLSIKLALVTVTVLYGAALLGVFLMQRQLQYFPSRSDPKPAEVGLSAVTVEHLVTPDGETVVLWSATAKPEQPTILFFHGNAGSIADRAARLAFYQSQGFGAAFLSYRGFGGSTGSISEQGLLTDAETAYDFLLSQGVPPASIVVLGESLGTGVAVQLAAGREVGAVILEAPYTSAADIAAGLYPWLPVRLLMRDQFRSIDHIAAVKAPLLILHGTEDRVIPFDFGQRLFAAANGPKTFRALDGLGHDALFDPGVWALEAAFLVATFPP
jgi:uncharacterized protein